MAQAGSPRQEITGRKIMKLEFDREVDGRWIAEVLEVPGAMAYGATKEEARAKAVAVANDIINSARI